MPWVKLDDRFPSHRKIALLSDRAFRLHVSAMCWCAENLTDGHISDRELGLVANVRSIKATAQQLQDAGLWDRVDGGWVIHDYLDYNPSRDQVLAERKKNAERQERFRQRKKGSPHPPPDGSRNGVTTGVTSDNGQVSEESSGGQTLHENDMSAYGNNSVSEVNSQVIELRNAVTNGAPTRPQPLYRADVGGSSTGSSAQSEQRPGGLHLIPDDFHLNDTMRRWVVALYPYLDADFETEQFVRYWRSEGRRKRNWHDAWQKWIADSAKKARDRHQTNPAAGSSRRASTGARTETHTADDYTNSKVEDLFAS